MQPDWAIIIAIFAAIAALMTGLANIFGLRFSRMTAQGALAAASADTLHEMRLALVVAQRDIAQTQNEALKSREALGKLLEEETQARKALQDALDASQAAWEKERAELKKRIEALESENAKLRQEVDALRKERDEERAKRQELETALQEWKERQAAAEAGKPKGNG